MLETWSIPKDIGRLVHLQCGWKEKIVETIENICWVTVKQSHHNDHVNYIRFTELQKSNDLWRKSRSAHP